MAKKKKHAEHVNHERWLVSYADFITLLFAFFVVLYSSSQVDHKKVGKLARAIETAFQELGMFQTSAVHPSMDDTAGTNEGPQTPQVTHLNRHPQSEAQSEAAALTKALALQIQKGHVRVKVTPEGTVISLRELGNFPSGSAVLIADAHPVLQQIADLIKPTRFLVRVEGHTDDVPIRTEQFHSNWELSSARAVAVLEELTRDSVKEERMSAVGYAQYRPVAFNDGEEGRAENRRVDIVILNGMQAVSDYKDEIPASILPPQPKIVDR